MTKLAKITLAAVLSISAAAPAFAGWDRTSVFDPAFDRSYDRQLEAAAGSIAPTPVVATSAIATNDAAGGKSWFGPQRDRAVDSLDSPYDN